MTSIIQNSDFTNFLQSGAVLQTSRDVFTLIWGPFTKLSGLDAANLDEKTIIYKPKFWDFTENKSGLCLTGAKELQVSRPEFLNLLQQHGSLKLNVQWDDPNEAEFRDQFHWSFQKFTEHKLKKTVPIIRQHGHTLFEKESLVFALQTVIQDIHFGYTFGFWQNGSGYLGHTPELVLNWSQAQIFKTVALAGTQEKEGENKRILQDSKILNEHQIVAIDLQEVLTKELPTKKLEIEGPSVLELKYLVHLVTTLQVKDVNQTQAVHLLKSIHPSAALGIYPRISEEYENLKKFDVQRNRAGFAAPFGFINNQSMLVVAAIRSFHFTANSVTLFSGCGLTSESVLQEELSEVEKKRNSVKKMMGMNL